MRFFSDLSLRWKIPLRVMGAVLGTALAVTVGLLVRDYEDMRVNMEVHAKSLGKVMASTLVAPLLHDDLWRAYEILESGRAAQSHESGLEAQVMMVLDDERRVFVASRPREYPVGSRPEEKNPVFAMLIAQLGEEEMLEQRVIGSAGSALYFVVTPLIADGVMIGHVALGYSRAALLPRYMKLVERAGIVTLLVLLLLLPASWFWARHTATPLLQLAKAMESVPDDPDSIELAAAPKNRDEVGRLGAAFARMVAELKKKQELESQVAASERLAAVGRLTAGIAHEINNPLGGMLTALKTYQRHGNADPLAQQTLSLLERGLMQIKNTVAALLVETRTQDRSLAPADIDDLLILIEPEAHVRHVNVAREGRLGRSLPLPATLVRQILLNLLLNAVDAAAEGGSVKLTCSNAPGLLRFAVSNDGQHIPEDQMSYLFEPFASNKAKGHGLGLWVVYQIVQQLNGGLLVESTPGSTVFRVEIPYDAKQ